MADDELTAAVEQIEQAGLAIWALEQVVLVWLSLSTIARRHRTHRCSR